MKTLLIRFFIENWQRKLLAIVLAIIVWMVINHSITVSKTIHNIPVRVVNLAPDKTIEGMKNNGILSMRVSLNLTGNRVAFENLSGNDLQAVVDASGKEEEWVAVIDKKCLVSVNPNLDLQTISNVIPVELVLRQTRLVRERIQVVVTQPIGEPPKGYEFLGIWPYQLSLNVQGSEEAIKQIKARNPKLTFNLNDISLAELNALTGQNEEVSFLVPDSWKKIMLQQVSDAPFEIDDPQAKSLRIDFTKQDLLPIGSPIPVTVFFPPKFSHTLNPDTYQIVSNDFIAKKNGIRAITTPLYAQGVSRLFLETVKDMLQLVVIAAPKSEREILAWNTQFMHLHELENKYVAKMMSETKDDREDYLRMRFRNYVNRFRLYTSEGKKLGLKIELQAKGISILPMNLGSSGEVVSDTGTHPNKNQP